MLFLSFSVSNDTVALAANANIAANIKPPQIKVKVRSCHRSLLIIDIYNL